MEAKTNFSLVEMELLLSLVDKYKDIIHSKITNAVFNKKKDDAWQKLAKEYNSVGTVPCRSVTQLKNKFKNMKKSAQKKKGDERVEYFKTGGGEQTTSILSPLEEKLISIGVVTQPLDNPFDSDANYYEASGTVLTDITNGDAAGRTDSPSPSPFIRAPQNETERAEISSRVEEMSSVLDRDSDSVDPVETTPRPQPIIQRPQAKRFAFSRQLRKPNASVKASTAIVDGAEARKLAIQQESTLSQEIKKKEHEAYMQALSEEKEYKRKIYELKIKNQEMKYEMLKAKRDFYLSNNKSSD